MKLAEKLDAPVCSGYQHNDSFPGSHALAVGPLGYNGSKAAMQLIAKADVVLALGTRLNPFSTLPGYGIDYWPKDAKIIQVDINADRIGLTKEGHGGHSAATPSKVAQRDPGAALSHRGRTRAARRAWRLDPPDQVRPGLQALSSIDHEDDDPGTDLECRRPQARRRPHVAASGLARDPGRAAGGCDHLVSDIGNNCAIGNAYPTFEQGRKYLAPGFWVPAATASPSILGAKIGCPDVPVVGFCRRRRLRHLDANEMTSMRPPGLARHHHGDLPQLPVGRGKAQHDRCGTPTTSSAPSSAATSATPRWPMAAA
jgi:sulfoacetaldehyde acetyltransferase